MITKNNLSQAAMKHFIFILFVLILFAQSSVCEEFKVTLRSQTAGSTAAAPVFQYDAQNWKSEETAIIVCDMWNWHGWLGGCKRIIELAPAIDQLLKTARDKGITIIHAPSGTMKFYADHPARHRAATYGEGKENTVPGIAERMMPNPDHWNKTPAELLEPFPVPAHDGDPRKMSPDDDPVREDGFHTYPGYTGERERTRQIILIHIDEEKDYISEYGVEIVSILDKKGIKNVILTGVHTDACILGRPFGLRNLNRLGLNAVLMRDMTDSLYNYYKLSHYAGNDKVFEFIERRVAPTVLSTDITGKPAFRFKRDLTPVEKNP
jgi:nicotinamidase-related amidase